MWVKTMSDNDHPDTDLTDPHGDAEALRKENERLRAEIAEATDPDFIWGAMDNVHDCDTTMDDYAAAVSRAQRAALAASRAPDPVVNAGSCQPGDLISHIAAHPGMGKIARGVAGIIAEHVAAPVAEAQPVAWRVYGMMRQGVPNYVKAQGQGSEPTEYLYPAHRATDAAECARLMRGKAQPLYAHPPAQPTIGGAELDALVARLLDGPSRVYRDIDADKRAAAAITTLRAQPDWKAMAERLGEAASSVVGRLIVAFPASEAFPAIKNLRAALSDLAKMKGE